MYKGCPISWKSQLRTEIYLSSTESECTWHLREVIPLIQLLQEMKQHSFPVNQTALTIRCRVLEDNSGALEIANNHNYRPLTKHLSFKLHHFRDYVTRKELFIEKIYTLSQLSDYLTKPANEQILCKLHKIVMRW